MKREPSEAKSNAEVLKRAKIEALEVMASKLGLSIPSQDLQSLERAAAYLAEEALSWRSALPVPTQCASAAVLMLRLGPVVTRLLSYGHRDDRYLYRELSKECVMGFDSVRPAFIISKGLNKRFLEYSDTAGLVDAKEFIDFITREMHTPWFRKAIPLATAQFYLDEIPDYILTNTPLSIWTKFGDLEIISKTYRECAKSVYSIAKLNNDIHHPFNIDEKI